MTPLTLDLPPEMRARLSEEAKRRNVTESAFVHAVVGKALAAAEAGADQARPTADPSEPGEYRPRSSARMNCLELAGDLIGCVRSGTPDLATNPRYLEEAIERDAKVHNGGGRIQP